MNEKFRIGQRVKMDFACGSGTVLASQGTQTYVQWDNSGIGTHTHDKLTATDEPDRVIVQLTPDQLMCATIAAEEPSINFLYAKEKDLYPYLCKHKYTLWKALNATCSSHNLDWRNPTPKPVAPTKLGPWHVHYRNGVVNVGCMTFTFSAARDVGTLIDTMIVLSKGRPFVEVEDAGIKYSLIGGNFRIDDVPINPDDLAAIVAHIDVIEGAK